MTLAVILYGILCFFIGWFCMRWVLKRAFKNPEMAEYLSSLEGKKEQVNIAQLSEIVKVIRERVI